MHRMPSSEGGMLLKSRSKRRTTPERLVTAVVISCLVLQNSGLALVTKMSVRVGASPYDSSTVVWSAEVTKMITCIVLEKMSGSGVIQSGIWSLKENFSLLLPATLYVAQNNLNFFAMRGLSPATFVVCSQMKILTSAVFSVWLLKVRLTKRKVAAVFMLTCGIAVAQLKDSSLNMQGDRLDSIMALMLAACLSGLSGVLLEKAFKRENDSLWMKNFHLAFFSLPFASFNSIRSVGWEKSVSSFYNGYDAVVVLMVLLQALGGLLTAAVMKYAGVISKCFAVSISTILCTLVGLQMGAETAGTNFVMGATLVNIAVYFYTTSGGK